MTTNELAQGDLALLTFNERKGPRIVLARINWIEERDSGRYLGYTPHDIKHGLFGAAMLRDEPQPFGLQEVDSFGNISVAELRDLNDMPPALR